MDAGRRGGYKEPACVSRAGLERFMRMFGAPLLAASLLVTGATAAPLKPGYPAGVRAARSGSVNTALMIGAGAVILAGVGILASGDSSVVDTLSIPGGGVTVNSVTNTTVSTSATSTTP
jgi:hypothetical protein